MRRALIKGQEFKILNFSGICLLGASCIILHVSCRDPILDLDWRDIAIDPPAESPEPGEVTNVPVAVLDILVKRVKLQRQSKIQNQCGTLQLWNISRPVKINDLYINVNILEEILSQQWLELADLQRSTSQACDRSSLGTVSQTQMAGMEAVEIYSKPRVLCKPGQVKHFLATSSDSVQPRQLCSESGTLLQSRLSKGITFLNGRLLNNTLGTASVVYLMLRSSQRSCN